MHEGQAEAGERLGRERMVSREQVLRLVVEEAGPLQGLVNRLLGLLNRNGRDVEDQQFGLLKEYKWNK